jgi:hypothetical protein
MENRAKMRLTLVLVAASAAIAAAVGPTAPTAQACSSYWNVPGSGGCTYYPPYTGHAETGFCCAFGETTRATFDTFSTILQYWVAAGGSWKGQQNVPYDVYVHWYSSVSSDKFGCHNHHTGWMFVNCHHHDGATFP